MYKQIDSKKVNFQEFKLEIIEGVKRFVYYYGDIMYVICDSP
jgi:hypothetical protein